MKRHLFITGPVQTGKSTLLMKAAAPYMEQIGGFVSQRLIDDNGNTRGFRLADLEESPSLTAPFDSSPSDIFLTLGEKRCPDLSVFENKGKEILDKTKEKRIILMDEIGGIELKSEAFRSMLFAVLDQNCCIGILKGDRSAANIEGGISKERELLLRHIREDEILPLEEASIETIRNFIEENI